ncbi:MAG: hypothetical protein KatS3mg129_3302 [Leptospiraceae bacterium]|nr:MAG: hypothetical protein KatS3mg129_3302 [Leptospiraceae bacterium]
MEILIDILIILTSNFIFLWIFSLLRIPTIIGLLLAGFIIGPYGLKFIENNHQIEVLSEIGIILLLFTIGLEFSLKELEKQKKDILLLGSLQILFSVIVVTIIFYQFYNLFISLIIGMIFSLSSTAIVLKLLQDENEIHSPYGKISIAILIFQDLVAIIYVILIPFLKNYSEQNNFSFNINDIFFFLSKILILGIIFFLLFKFIVPFLLYQIVKTRNKDLFVLTIITFCFLIAFGTYKFGLS